MAFNFGIDRPLITQNFRTFAVTLALGVAVPLDAGGNKQQLITSFAISNPSTSGASIFIGNEGVTVAGGNNPGFEIQAGTAPAFKESQEGRQLYELQGLLGELVRMAGCANIQLEKIPVQVFDMSKVFAVAGANVTFTVITFPLMYL